MAVLELRETKLAVEAGTYAKSPIDEGYGAVLKDWPSWMSKTRQTLGCEKGRQPF